MTGATLDEARVEAFAGRLFELYTGGMLTFMVDIGHRTGLFAAAAAGPATSVELAERADLQERYVREWLGAMVTGGIVDLDPATGTYRLPAEHAACLTGPGSGNLAPFSRLDTHLAKHVDAVARAFREGGGVPYAEFRPEFTDVMDALGRGVFDELLVEEYLPLVPGLGERLAAGARVADVGCGTGHAIVLLAGFTSVPTEILDAARVDGTSFMQRFRFVVVPMIAPILLIGFLFDTVFTLSDLSIVYLLTQGGPANATKILPVLAYQVGIQAGALGRGAAISLFLFPLLMPLMILLLRNLRRREY